MRANQHYVWLILHVSMALAIRDVRSSENNVLILEQTGSELVGQRKHVWLTCTESEKVRSKHGKYMYDEKQTETMTPSVWNTKETFHYRIKVTLTE